MSHEQPDTHRDDDRKRDPARNPNNPDVVPDDHGAKADRPGGPGQSSANPVERGRLAPAPDPDAVDEDEVITARREHQKSQARE